jgi:hypothetical protein
MPLLTSFEMDFTHGQFLVYDVTSQAGFAWTQAHSDQGFARSERAVAFGTVEQQGFAAVRLHLGAYEHREGHHRVISVPFTCHSGTVHLCGPVEVVEHPLSLEPGCYRVTAAQTVIGEALYDDEVEEIDLYFEPLAFLPERSEILVADEWLRPTYPLLEHCDFAELHGAPTHQ